MEVAIGILLFVIVASRMVVGGIISAKLRNLKPGSEEDDSIGQITALIRRHRDRKVLVFRTIPFWLGLFLMVATMIFQVRMLKGGSIETGLEFLRFLFPVVVAFFAPEIVAGLLRKRITRYFCLKETKTLQELISNPQVLAHIAERRPKLYVFYSRLGWCDYDISDYIQEILDNSGGNLGKYYAERVAAIAAK